MNPILLYIVKAAFYTAAFYAVYSLLLSRDTLYARNRLFILVSLAASLILPLITIRTARPAGFQAFGKMLGEIFITGNGRGSYASGDWPDKEQIILLLYLAGITVSVLKTITDSVRLLMIISKGTGSGSHVIHFSGLRAPAFTAFGRIFINDRLSQDEAAEILRHEQNHLDKNHSFDILFIQLVKAIQWFNPFIYWFDRSLRAVHEYQADERCISSGTPVTAYQNLLMNQVLDTRLFSISNSFSNPALIKKRMIMMTKKRSGMLANFKILIVVPAVAAVLMGFSYSGEKSRTGGSTKNEFKKQSIAFQQADTVKKVKKGTALPKGSLPPPPPPPPPPPVSGSDTLKAPFVQVDELPQFPGDEQGLMNYVTTNLRYPEEAKKKGITGKVIVRFAVESDCSIDKISIIRGVDPALDAEAFRVVSSLPHFSKPGILKGKPVPVWFMIPINFALK
jgi:TonB family protein